MPGRVTQPKKQKLNKPLPTLYTLYKKTYISIYIYNSIYWPCFLNVLMIFQLIFFIFFSYSDFAFVFEFYFNFYFHLRFRFHSMYYIYYDISHTLTRFLFPQFQQKCFLLIETCSWIGLTVIRHTCYTHTHKPKIK